MRRGIVAVAGVAMAVALLTACADDDDSTSTGTQSPAASVPAASGLTMASYESITAGMTVEQVAAIAQQCQQTAQTEASGHQLVAYSCEGAQPFTGATFVFSDGKLVTKAQYGLDGGVVSETGQMTKAKYDQLQTGQTAAEVEAITGPCTKSSETELAGHRSYTLTCYAADGVGSALLLLVDDELVSKSQSGLA